MVNLDYLYNPDAAKKFFDKNYFVDRKLGFKIIEHGMILPHKKTIEGQPKNSWGFGGIVDGDGNYVKSSFISESSTGGFYALQPETIQYRPETVIYLTMFYNIWGHVLTDNIRRLWFLNTDVFKREFKNCPIVYIPWHEGEYTIDTMPDAARLLEILGVDLDRLQPITQPTRFDKIILPDGSFSSGFTNEYRETIDIVRQFALKNRTPTSSKKIYFFYGRNQVGEERLAEYFKSKGYEIINHKQRSDFDEELNLLINCESFAAPLGSCAHNSIFLRDGTETIFILRAANSFAGYQTKINQVNNLNANYADSTMSIFNSNHDSFCFIISEQLKRFFGDKFDGYEEEDFKTFLKYVRSPVRKGRTIVPRQLEGYGAIFSDFMEQLKRRKDLIDACDMPPGWETFRPLLNYQTYVHKRAWRDRWKSENLLSNPPDQKLEILAIRLKFPSTFHKIYYSVYFVDAEGWSEEVLAPEISGTVGERKPIFGMKVRLNEAGAKEFDILYRMHKFNGSWTPWAKNGEELFSGGVKLNAVQIKLQPKSDAEKIITTQI